MTSRTAAAIDTASFRKDGIRRPATFPVRMRFQSASGARAGRSSASLSSKSVMIEISQLLLERGQAAVISVFEGLLADAGDGGRLGNRKVPPDLEDDGLPLLGGAPKQDF